LYGYVSTTAQSDASELKHIQFFTKKAIDNLARSNNFKNIKYCKTNFVEAVITFSILSNWITFLQKMDCAIAEILPYSCTGEFVKVWQKNIY
jgi:hypothetical protein